MSIFSRHKDKGRAPAEAFELKDENVILDHSDDRADRASKNEAKLQESLAAIARDAFEPVADRTLEGRLLGIYSMCPGVVRPGMKYIIEPGSDDLHILDIDLGDKTLERRGIGALIIASAVKSGLKERHELRTVGRDSGNLPFAKAIGKVVGLHNLSLAVGGVVYGYNGELPAEAAWENHPADELFPAQMIQGVIDRRRIDRIDVAAGRQQLLETGHAALWGGHAQ